MKKQTRKADLNYCSTYFGNDLTLHYANIKKIEIPKIKKGVTRDWIKST